MSREFPERPFAAVIAVVRRAETVLLVRRGQSPNKGKWGFPGGVQNLGETVIAAAQRELAEETGVAGRWPRVVDAIDAIEYAPDGRVSHHFTLVVVALDWLSGEGEAATDADAAGWFRVDELVKLNVLPKVEILARGAIGNT